MKSPDSGRGFSKPDLSEDTIVAIKLCAQGKANAGQQIAVIEAVLHKLAIVDGLSYRPTEAGGERETAFAEGRRFVGLELRTIILLPLSRLLRTKPAPAAKPKVNDGR